MTGCRFLFLANRGHCAVLVFHCVTNLPTVALMFNSGNSRNVSAIVSTWFIWLICYFPPEAFFMVCWKSIKSHVNRSKVAVLHQYIEMEAVLFQTQLRSWGQRRCSCQKCRLQRKDMKCIICFDTQLTHHGHLFPCSILTFLFSF